MNGLWTKERRIKTDYSNKQKENVVIHASGDGFAQTCKVCGNEINGNNVLNDRYDQLLYDCFGVIVSPADSLLCDWCARQLKNTERFQALIHAAYGKPKSENSTQMIRLEPNSEIIEDSAEKPATISYKDIVDLLNTTSNGLQTKNGRINKHILPSLADYNSDPCHECVLKREKGDLTGRKGFLCNKCSGNQNNVTICPKCNVSVPVLMMQKHMDMHVTLQKKLIEKKRMFDLPKRYSSTKQREIRKNVSLPKYKCLLCPKKYLTVKHLAEHAKCIHCASRSQCAICGVCVKRNESLVKHLESHTKDEQHGVPSPKTIKKKRFEEPSHRAPISKWCSWQM